MVVALPKVGERPFMWTPPISKPAIAVAFSVAAIIAMVVN
jgi:hypothetical protein